MFGVKKGSYTGADFDKAGLLEKADGGILFLDEVHRLPAEGQEMFFTFMDRGVYRRLGETESERRAKVLIITATTEDPNTTLLKTFTRRIPMVIMIPSLKNRGMEERFNLIKQFMIEESGRLGKSIKVSINAIKAFLSYDCESNIGQLKSDVQLACAKAYADFLSNKKSEIKISSLELPGYIAEGLYKETEHRQLWNKLIDINKRYYIFGKEEEKEIFDKNETSRNIYEMLDMKTIKLKARGINGNEFEEEMENDIEDYFKKYMDLDMSIIKEIGANAIRLSHYQHNDYFYTLCDREGILVWAEIPFISVTTTSDKENKNAKEQLERLIKQAYNHSSIYCWGVQNEITIITENEQIYKKVKELVAMARDLDSSRFIAQANVYSVANESPLNELTDLLGYNLYYGWYYKEIQDLGKRLDEFHKVRPNIPVMVTEYGVDTNPKLHSYNPTVKDYTEEYQLLFENNALKTFNDRPFVLGGYVWAMFDFGSEIRNEGGIKGRNQKGLVTIDRKTKKDSFYLCKAYWSKEHFVKLAGSRFVNRHKELNDIIVLSNVSHVKLYVNNEFTCELNSDEPMKKFEAVKLILGENKIKVEAFDDDGDIFTDEMILKYVSESDQSYILKKSEEKTHVTNWFEKFDLSNVQEVAIKEGYYSTFDTIEELYKNEQAKAIFKKYFGDADESQQFKIMMGLMTIDGMSKHSRFNIPKELLNVINKELNVIPKESRDR